MTSTATASAPAGTTSDLVVDVRGLSVTYGAFTAVDAVDLDVRRGEVFALLGTNGAGKTSTLEALQGFRRRSAGSVAVLGEDPMVSTRRLRAASGTMVQEAGFVPEATPLSALQLWASLSSRVDDADAVLERVGLAHRRTVLVKDLSGGEKRRLDLALAVWGAPELIVLDEPTTGLDPESRATLWALVRELRDGGTTVLMTTHHLEEAEALADRVAIMHRGRIAVAGTLAEVLRERPARITAVRRHPGQPAAAAEHLDLRTRHLQRDLLALLLEADRAGAVLDQLRATPASLEEVFHAVVRGDLATTPAREGASR
ncbi:ABC transporter ATP-binding protein [Quadrisphaera setariae]|uniref:ABC transporter ATP-binding protein n=1 Tax=Quadrisphaera setariae TaxID=2593304 RepID=A0A5C8Z6M5_9ACTN|nr:ABC transporter ATP-binding protein [Quadrisphaera setariae]TXR52590.1 ABC transporter ATP-binding protein [Quadrisphaera setariae]